MKKVININFCGQVIAIEETAYEILKQYIASLKNYFSKEDGGDEIVNDIENRIAELFGNRLKLGINCITDEDVESIISSIGRPEDFDPEYKSNSTQDSSKSENSYSTESQPKYEKTSRPLYRNSNDKIIGGVCSGLAHYFKIDPAWMRIIFVFLFGMLFWVYIILWIVLKSMPLESNITKRLYRNPNNRYLGGVCGGIAAYFKIDAWIPRLIFIAPLLIGSFGMLSFPFALLRDTFDIFDYNWNINGGIVIVYVVLWIILPMATTVKQKLEMMGEEEYIQSLRATVSDNVSQTKSRYAGASSESNSNFTVDSEGNRMSQMPPVPPTNGGNRRRNDISDASSRSGCLTALGVFAKILFFAFAGIFAIVLAVVLFAFIFVGAQFMPLKSLFIDSGMETNLLWAFGILSIGVPFAAIVLWIIRRSIRAKSRPVIGAVASVLWVIGIFCGLALSFQIAKKYSSESTVSNSIQLTPTTSNTLYVEPIFASDDLLQFKTGFGPGAYLDYLLNYNEQKDSLFFYDIDVDIVESKDSLFYVRTVSSSYDYNKSKAKKNIHQFTYPIQQKDSLLMLSTYFSVPFEQGFRAQSIDVEIAVPKGKRVELNPEIENLNAKKRFYNKRKFGFDDFDDFDSW